MPERRASQRPMGLLLLLLVPIFVFQPDGWFSWSKAESSSAATPGAGAFTGRLNVSARAEWAVPAAPEPSVLVEGLQGAPEHGLVDEAGSQEVLAGQDPSLLTSSNAAMVAPEVVLPDAGPVAAQTKEPAHQVQAEAAQQEKGGLRERTSLARAAAWQALSKSVAEVQAAMAHLQASLMRMCRSLHSWLVANWLALKSSTNSAFAQLVARMPSWRRRALQPSTAEGPDSSATLGAEVSSFSNTSSNDSALVLGLCDWEEHKAAEAQRAEALRMEQQRLHAMDQQAKAHALAIPSSPPPWLHDGQEIDHGQLIEQVQCAAEDMEEWYNNHAGDAAPEPAAEDATSQQLQQQGEEQAAELNQASAAGVLDMHVAGHEPGAEIPSVPTSEPGPAKDQEGECPAGGHAELLAQLSAHVSEHWERLQSVLQPHRALLSEHLRTAQAAAQHAGKRLYSAALLEVAFASARVEPFLRPVLQAAAPYVAVVATWAGPDPEHSAVAVSLLLALGLGASAWARAWACRAQQQAALLERQQEQERQALMESHRSELSMLADLYAEKMQVQAQHTDEKVQLASSLADSVAKLHEEYKQRLQDLQAHSSHRVAQMGQQSAAARSSLKRLAAGTRSACETAASMRKSVDTIVSHLKQEGRSTQQLQQQVHQARAQLLRTNLAQSQQALQALIATHKEGARQLAQERSKHQGDLQALQSAHAAQMARIKASYSAALRSMRARHAQSMRAWLSLRENHKILLDHLQARAALQAQEHNLALVRCEEQLRAERSRAAGLREELLALRQQVADKDAVIADMEAHLDEQGQETSCVQQELVASKQQIVQLKKLMDQLQGALQASEEKVQNHEGQTRATEEKLQEVEEECEKLHNEVRDLKERNNHVEVELLKAEKLKGAVEKASKDIKALVDMNRLGNEQLAALENVVAEREGVIQQLQGNLRELEETKQAMECELRAALEAKDKEMKRLAEAKDKEIRLRLNDITLLKNDNARLEDEMKALRKGGAAGPAGGSSGSELRGVREPLPANSAVLAQLSMNTPSLSFRGGR